jgi:plasmid stability protein
MPNLSIKNVPDAIVEKLRERAARNHRSLQGELMELVCRVANESSTREEPGERTRAIPLQAHRGGTKTIEKIAAEHRARWKEPFTQGPFAVDMIRADRDAR